MKTIIVGTTNPAKKGMVQAALSQSEIIVKGTDDLNIKIDIIEDGITAQENARKKALVYAHAAGKPVLSIDHALYLVGLPDDEQPGVDTRSVPGVDGRASDEQLLQYYSERIKRLGGSIDGHWEFALCIADEFGTIVEKTIVSPRVFVSTPSALRLPGYPLESIQIDPGTGVYISDMTIKEQDAFWQEIIGAQLRNFIDNASTTISQIIWNSHPKPRW